MVPDALLVGCGDLGARIGLCLAELGRPVLALRRHADRVPPPLLGLPVDVTREVPPLPDLSQLQYLVIALTARPRTEDAYRTTYVDGVARLLEAMEQAGGVPRRAVLVSSTAVFGDHPSSRVVDETTPAHPTDGPGQVLLDAEEQFLARVQGGTVLRLSGLYGSKPSRLVTRVVQGQVEDPHRWTNRIHRDDAAAAVIHLLTRPAIPDPLYVGTDNEPAQLGDVAAFLAKRLGAPEPPAADVRLAHGKRLTNTRLRASGWAPRHPTYRDGYAR